MIKLKIKNDRYRGIIYCIIASVLWSTGGVLVKQVNWNPLAIAGGRSFVTALVVLIYIKKPRIIKSKTFLAGVISCAGTVICFILANKLTSPANAILLQYTSPIFVAILSVIVLKEKIHWYDVLVIVIVSFGILMFFIENVSAGNIIGNIIAIFTGISLAVITISLKSMGNDSTLEIILFGNLLAFLLTSPFVFQEIPDLRSIIFIIILGVFQLGIAYIFYVLAIRHISALEAILITVLEPLLSPLWVYLFTGESPGIYAMIGGFIVITAVMARGIYTSRKKEEIIKI